MVPFDSTSYIQRRNLEEFPSKIYPALEFSSKLMSYFRIFGQKVYTALEFSGKRYTQKNGKSPGTPT